MAERSDIFVEWNRTPRHIIVEAPSVELIQQDLTDTANGPLENDWNGIDEPQLISPSGKQTLDAAGNKVGITNTLQNAVISFEARTTPVQIGTATTGDITGKILIDSAALYITNGVEPGAVIINFNDLSVSTVITVDSEVQITHEVLVEGTTNTWVIGDTYKIWNIIQCNLSGGNTVSVDEAGDPISPIAPTAFTQILLTSSSSATFQASAALQYASFQNAAWFNGDSPYGDIGNVDEPNGNAQRPVNTIPLVIEVAGIWGFSTIMIETDVTIPDGSILDNFIIKGKSHVTTQVDIANLASVEDVRILDVDLSGTLDGGTDIWDCIIRGITYFNGHIHESALAGRIKLGGGVNSYIVNCSRLESIVPIIDFQDTAEQLTMPNYTGLIRIENMTDIGAMGNIGLGRGSVMLDSTTISAGILSVTGIGRVVDEAGTYIEVGIGINWNGLILNNVTMSNESVAFMVWDYSRSGSIVVGSMGETMTLLWDEAGGDRTIDPVNFQEIFFKAGGVEVMRFNLFDENDNPSIENVHKRIRV